MKDITMLGIGILIGSLMMRGHYKAKAAKEALEVFKAANKAAA